jgi:Ice-binding-like
MKGKHLILLATMGLAALLHGPSPALAQEVSLGSAQSFAVLGASTVTNTGLTIITGDLGVYPGTAITGFPPGIVNGTIHAGDGVAAQAHSDAVFAYAALAGLPCPPANNLSGQDLGGLTLAPGVYCFDTSAQLTGTLNLVGGGPWIFQIGSTLTTASNSSVLVKNGHNDCNGSNVFWQVGSSATIGTGTQFVGNILALISITLTTNANVSGSALALTGAVTMDTNQVSVCGAGGAPFPHGAIKVTGGGQIPVPDPNSADPTAGGTGRATFGFNAKPSKSGGTAASGEFNYVNHVTGLHINGPVTTVEVIAINPDGVETVRFSGTCRGSSPSCSFSVTVEDHGEPGTIDEFGIAVTGGATEVRSQRVISNGNIQFHGK